MLQRFLNWEMEHSTIGLAGAAILKNVWFDVILSISLDFRFYVLIDLFHRKNLHLRKNCHLINILYFLLGYFKNNDLQAIL